MPFPATLAAMFSSGYDYARWEHCATCGEPVELYTTPGGRTIAMEPMCSRESPAVRHYEVCKPKEEQDGNTGIDVQDAQGRVCDGGASRTMLNGSGRGVEEEGCAQESGRESLRVGQRDAQGSGIKLYAVTDPNHQLVAVGWDDGVLVCQFKTAKWSYAGVPEAESVKLRRVPYAYRIFTTNIKGKYPATKLE